MYKSIKFSNIAVIEYRVLSNIPSPCTIFSIIEHNSEHFQDIGKKMCSIELSENQTQNQNLMSKFHQNTETYLFE